MKAIIMAGGKGTRLAPFTATFPKPLMPLGNMPILELILRQLKMHGVNDVVLAVNHLSHLIQAFLGDGSRLGLSISYSHEHIPLGTAGPLGAVLGDMDEDFFLLNGDLLTTLNFSSMLAEHVRQKAAATIATYERELKSDFGVLRISEDGCLKRYEEKPVYRHSVSMGCYVLSRPALEGLVVPGVPLDMPQLMQKLLDRDKKVFCYHEKCFWLDIGRPDDYSEAQRLVENNESYFLPTAGR